MSNGRYQRGEVYLVSEHGAEGSEQKKTRPWILVGANWLNRARSTLIAVPTTTQQKKELPNLCIPIFLNGIIVYAVLDQIRALDKKRFIKFDGGVTDAEMDLIDDGLRNILSL